MPMDQATAGFVATLSFRTALRSATEGGNPRERFWRVVQERTQPQFREIAESIDQLENGAVAAFPAALHAVLMQHYQLPSRRFNEFVIAHPRELNAVFFGASIEGYGSALLAIDVGGVKELAELLNGNIDTFTLLMEAFVPAAFANVIPSDHRGSDFEATIAPTAELSRVFAQIRLSQAGHASSIGAGTIAPPAEGTAGWIAKFPRAVVATAFSLLTPVVLSLVVLYCTAQMLLQERADLSKREATLIADEQALRKAERSAAEGLHRENIELLRLLRPSATTNPPKP